MRAGTGFDRRRFIAALAGALAPAVWAAPAANTLRVGAAWRAAAGDRTQYAGALAIDWARREVSVRYAVPLPGRAHGLMAEPGGGLLVVAMRPGAWLWRVDGDGQVARRLTLDDEPGDRRLAGHVLESADGRWLYTTETDSAQDGWIGVRDRQSLRKVAEWPTHGVDPHQLVLDREGRLIVANGGILRTPEGRKRDLDRMSPSLVQLDARSGALLGQWRLPDPRLSLRHLAWSEGPQGPLLGIALQAEHDDPARRMQAPVLAVWDGRELNLPTAAAEAEGYAGDIARVPGGGFALSGQKANCAVVWRPQRPAALERIAALTDPCALAPALHEDGAVLMAAAKGIGRWHPQQPAAMLAWPEPMALDNHWVVLQG
jgi:uncharacterized protein